MLRLVTAAALFGAVEAVSKPNPIRRVVTLLEEMAEEIEAEVDKEKKAFAKFQCFCKKNDGELGKKAAEQAAVIKRTRAEVESLTGQKKQLAVELKKHKADRAQAQKDLSAATKKRTEEKAKYDEATKDVKKTLEDIDKAISALEKGMGKSFLQTNAAAELKQLFSSASSTSLSLLDKMDVADQRSVSVFLEQKENFSPASGEIVGILKMMKDNFDESLGGIIGEEVTAVETYKKLKASLEGLIKSSGATIEKKTELKGQIAVKIVEGKNLISTTEKSMGDDAATLAELKEACKGKNNDFETRQKDAAEEVDAIHQAIGVLDNDDSLQLFNKTDTKAEEGSFLQITSGQNSPIAKTLQELSRHFDNKAVSLLAFSAKSMLKSKSGVDFSKVVKMIDNMVALLKQEATDDLASRDKCTADFTDSAAEKKDVSHAIEGLSASIEELAAVASQKGEAMKKASDETAAAKQAMAEATQQRKADNADFVVAVDLNKQAVDLIQKAKNKLNAYYNPQLVPKEKAVELSTEEEIEAGARTVFAQALPKGAPETWAAGDRKNKGQKGASVLALMDMLANDLNKDTAAMEHDEKTSQSDYEKLSSDLAKSVVESTTAFNEAKQSKAQAEDQKQTAESTLSMKEEELADVKQTIADLHAQCDFILSAFEERKAARENEVSGLDKAKAILSGAKFPNP